MSRSPLWISFGGAEGLQCNLARLQRAIEWRAVQRRWRGRAFDNHRLPCVIDALHLLLPKRGQVWIGAPRELIIARLKGPFASAMSAPPRTRASPLLVPISGAVLLLGNVMVALAMAARVYKLDPGVGAGLCVEVLNVLRQPSKIVPGVQAKVVLQLTGQRVLQSRLTSSNELGSVSSWDWSKTC